MKVSKVFYFLIVGGVLAIVAILISFYQPNLIEEKVVVVPLVKEVDLALSVFQSDEFTCQFLRFGDLVFSSILLS